jgi:hypothetical protein
MTDIRPIRYPWFYSSFTSLQDYFPCEIHKLSLRDLRRSKLTHFPIIVKKKGSSRGYFTFEITHLRLNRGLEIICWFHRGAAETLKFGIRIAECECGM